MSGANPLSKAKHARAVIFSPLAIVLCLPVAIVTLDATPFGMDFLLFMLEMPTLLIVLIGSATYSAVILFKSFRNKRLHGGISHLILLVFCVLFLTNLSAWLRHLDEVGDIIHFMYARPYYERQIALLPTTQGPRLEVFNWGGMVWASKGIVYDESDEVALPEGQQSASWLARPGRAELACSGYGTTPLWGHYYLASFPC